MDKQNNAYMMLPGISPEEMAMLQQATAELSDEQKMNFFNIYAGKRKSPQDMLLFCLLGLFVVPGIQRFIIGEIGMGILYLFTIGLCFIGSIVDVVNHKSLAFEYNKKMAYEAYQMVNMGGMFK